MIETITDKVSRTIDEEMVGVKEKDITFFDGVKAHYEYNQNGQIIHFKSGKKEWWRDFDSKGREIRFYTDKYGCFTEYHDEEEEVVTMSHKSTYNDPLLKVERKNPGGRTIRVSDYQGFIETWEYDAQDRLIYFNETCDEELKYEEVHEYDDHGNKIHYMCKILDGMDTNGKVKYRRDEFFRKFTYEFIEMGTLVEHRELVDYDTWEWRLHEYKYNADQTVETYSMYKYFENLEKGTKRSKLTPIDDIKTGAYERV